LTQSVDAREGKYSKDEDNIRRVSVGTIEAFVDWT